MTLHNADREQATRLLCEFVAASNPGDLPQAVRREARRAFLNILGCAIGGSRHEIVSLTKDALRDYWGPPQATLLAQGEKTDILHAAYINCLSSSVDSFDDSHAEAIIHPSGPVASVLLALSERRKTTGAEFLHAFALGIEVICRVTKAVCVAPARGGLAWVQTPIVGGLGAAAAAGRLLGLDSRRLGWALGIAGSQASGYRGNHGTMNMPLMPAQAARSGLFGALLAERGITSSDATLEGRYGFCEVFSEQPNVAAITDRLGESFDLLGTTYKPYPCGIVVNPTLEACLRLKERCSIVPDAVERIEVHANPTAAAIANRRHPADPLAAQVSLQHWAAVALAYGMATKGELSPERIADPGVVRLRDRTEVAEAPPLAEDAAEVVVLLSSGERLNESVDHCIGSANRPMTEAELEGKFRGLSKGLKSDEETDRLIERCWNIDDLDDMEAITRLAS
ncbi:MAG TPA: MmgE/PrpD family protein [Hyphomicrobiaceae bacterium]